MKYSALFLPALLAVNIGATVGLALLWFQPKDAVWLVRDYVYYEILVAAFIFSLYSFRVAKQYLSIVKLKICLSISLAALVGTGFLVTREAPLFKIVQDEYAISTIALNIHLQHRTFSSAHSYYVNNEFVTGINTINKRPSFFPFILATVHDIFGYDTHHVFRLNAAITFVLLLVVGLIGYLFKRLPGALFAILLVVSIPLFAQNATGAGFELLNVLLILITFLLAWLHLEQQDSATLTALVFSALLLAQTRYESILFLGAVGVIALIVWLRSGRLPLNFYLLISPLFLLIPLVHLRWVMQENPIAVWQTPGGASSAFGSNFLVSNSFSALEYFLTPNTTSSMNAFIGVLLVLSLSIFLYTSVKKLPYNLDNKNINLLTFTVVSIVNFYILMSYFWGGVRDPVVSRLTLPLITMGILSLIALYTFSLWKLRILASYLVVSFYFITLPATSAGHYTSVLQYAFHSAWPVDYLKKHDPSGNYIVISMRPLAFISSKLPAIMIDAAIGRATQVKFQIDNRTVDAVYVVQSVYFDPKDNTIKIAPANELGKQYRLETLAERQFASLYRTRISKVVGITPDPNDKPENYPGFAELARTGQMPNAPVTNAQARTHRQRLP